MASKPVDQGDESADVFREAMATLGVKAGGRSARAAPAPKRAEPRAPEVTGELDFDAIMRADLAGDAAPVRAARGAPAGVVPSESRATPEAARPVLPIGRSQAPEVPISAADRELFERSIAGLDPGPAAAIPKAESAYGEVRGRPSARPATPDYARLLKHGRLPFDATCDLHGLIREEARARLGRLFEEAAREGWRVLRIVVGKGYHSSGEPVLRGAVQSWLGGVFSQDVELVLDAPEIAGGSGAIVVVTKRR